MPESVLIPMRARAITGEVLDTRVLPTPVPGLVLSLDRCMGCGSDAYALMHVRSGTALMGSHSAEAFGRAWELLATVDWTVSADDLANDEAAAVVVRVLSEVLPDTFLSTVTSVELGDINDLA